MSASGHVPEWTVQDRLRKARESAGLEQAELAARIGVARTTIGNYERGITPPKRPLLLSWALATGVPSDWLESGKESPDGDGEPGGVVVRHQGLEPRTRWLRGLMDIPVNAA